jgi:hypothetical protein
MLSIARASFWLKLTLHAPRRFVDIKRDPPASEAFVASSVVPCVEELAVRHYHSRIVITLVGGTSRPSARRAQPVAGSASPFGFVGRPSQLRTAERRSGCSRPAKTPLPRGQIVAPKLKDLLTIEANNVRGLNPM